MRLSFVIPAYNEEAYLGKCLDSISREIKKHPDYDIEIVVVNNASTDGTRRVAKKYRGVKIVDEPQRGLVKARRAGFLAATGDLIANTDADTILTPDWIETVFHEFSKNPKLVALSGPFIYYDLSRRLNFWVKFFYYIAFISYLLNRYILRLGSMLQGGNFVVRRTALEAIGGYNPNIEFYGEDTDMARRLHKVGQVKFTFRLPILTSGRRLAEEGVLTMALRYGINYFWMIWLGRPFSKASIVIRSEQKNGQLKYQPMNKAREWLIASISVIILLVFLGGVGYIGYRLVESSAIQAISLVELKADAEKAKNKLNDFYYSTKTRIQTRINELGQ